MARNNSVIEQDGSKATGEVAVRANAWDDETLLGVDSFDAALALVESTFGAVEVASETLGNGFTVFNGSDKDIFIGQPMILMSWNFNVGDNSPFVSITAVAKMPGGGTVKAIINDGGTGIYAQLDTLYKRTGKLGGLRVEKGLRRSDYTYDDNGVEKPASTYYLDTSA